jgi:hypothetical protein
MNILMSATDFGSVWRNSSFKTEAHNQNVKEAKNFLDT